MNPQDEQPTTTAVALNEPSNKTKWLVLAVAVPLALVAIVAGVILTLHEANRQASAASEPAAQVIITAQNASPTELQVRKGQAVVWVNQDSAPHGLTVGNANLPGFGTTGRLQQGQSYSYVFDKTGTFQYYDPVNPLAVSGEVIVKD